MSVQCIEIEIAVLQLVLLVISYPTFKSRSLLGLASDQTILVATIYSAVVVVHGYEFSNSF
jgi:hypothetical protein